MINDYPKRNAFFNCTNKIHLIRALRIVLGASLSEAFDIIQLMGAEILKSEQIDKDLKPYKRGQV